MPKVTPSDREMANRNTRAVINAAKEMQGYGNQKLITVLNISRTEFYRRQRDTDNYRLGDIRKLTKILHLTDEDIIRIVRGKEK